MSLETYAGLLRKKVETLYPGEALLQGLIPDVSGFLDASVKVVQPLFDTRDSVFTAHDFDPSTIRDDKLRAEFPLQIRHPLSLDISDGWVHRTQCPVCDAQSARLHVLLSRPYAELVQCARQNGWGDFPAADEPEAAWFETVAFTLLRCRDCGCIFHEYVLNDEGMRKLYTQWARRGQVARRHRTPARGHVRKLRARLSKILFAQEHFRHIALVVLDYGGGWGDFAALAHACGCQAHLSEVSAEKVARHQDVPGVKAMLVGTETPGAFDVINLSQVLEHVPAPLSVLTHLHTLLKPGGLLFLDVPHLVGARLRIHWDKRSGKPYRAYRPPQHINLFTHTSLQRIAHRAGFRIVQRHYSRLAWCTGMKGVVDVATGLLRAMMDVLVGTALVLEKPVEKP
jgi:SAM-dependent methyltransferase